MALLDLDTFRTAPLAMEPFPYLVVPGFLHAEAAQAVRRDFPDIAHPGLLPLEATEPGPAFAALIRELTGANMAAIVSEKFGLDLSGRPTMVTLRGHAPEENGEQDDRFHTDSETRLVTALLYFNADSDSQSGYPPRGPDGLVGMEAGVPPALGTLVAFRRAHHAFHRHEPPTGARRFVMINWMTSGLAARRELMRHRLARRTPYFPKLSLE